MNVIVTFNAKPEVAEDFESMLRDTQESLPDVEGCDAVSVYRKEGSSYCYTLIETWQSKEKHQTHISAMVKSGAWDNILRMLTQPPESAYFTGL